MVMIFAMAFTGCSVTNVADNVYNKGVEVYKVGEKVHDGLETVGGAARKAGEVYINLKTEHAEDEVDTPLEGK
jgi:hypothetical protein